MFIINTNKLSNINIFPGMFELNYSFFNVSLVKSLLSHGYSYPTPSNLNYFWGFGSLIGIMLLLQVISGLLLTLHYSSVSTLSNYSVEYIIRDVEFGWALKFAHSSIASLIFLFLYIHIGKGFYFRSFRKKLVWISGLVIFFLMMGVSFLGYTLPYGQMSLWGATVITNVFYRHV